MEVKYYVGVHFRFSNAPNLRNIYELITFDLHVLEDKQHEQVSRCQSA